MCANFPQNVCYLLPNCDHLFMLNYRQSLSILHYRQSLSIFACEFICINLCLLIALQMFSVPLYCVYMCVYMCVHTHVIVFNLPKQITKFSKTRIVAFHFLWGKQGMKMPFKICILVLFGGGRGLDSPKYSKYFAIR